MVDKLLGLGAQLVIISNCEEDYYRLSLYARAKVDVIYEIKPYTAEQALKMIEEHTTLNDWKVSREVLKAIASKCKGNAALSLATLRGAVVRAELERRKARIEDIPEVIDESKLSEDKRMLLKLLRKHKRLKAGELYNLCAKKATLPETPRTFREYMQSLRAKRFVKFIGSRRWKVYELAE